MRKVSKMMVVVVSLCVIAVSAIYYNYKFVRYDSDKIVFGATYMTMNNSFYKAITDEIEKTNQRSWGYLVYPGLMS